MNVKGSLRWFLVFGAVLLASFITLASTPNAFGCETGLSSLVQCAPQLQITSTVDTVVPTLTATATFTATETVVPTLTVTATLTVTETPSFGATFFVTPTLTITPTNTPKPTATAIPTPRGDSPETARVPMWVKPEYCIEAMCPGQLNAPLLNSPGNWEWIPANSTVWYKMDDGKGLQMQVWVFANGQTGLTLDIFAPNQQDLWNAKPIGTATQNKNYPGDDLFYSGRSAASGIWYGRLTNHNPYPVYYTIRYTRTTPTLANVCVSCHASIGYDWDGCVNGSDPNFCGKLMNLLDMNPQCYNHDINNDLQGCK